MHLRGRTPPRDAVHHPLFARFYARFSVAADARGGIAAYREELLAGLSGRVVEIGAGNGLNFAHYPGAVSEVVALEPERSLRQFAVRAALRAEVPVDVVPGAAEAIPMKNEGFDAAVASLVLCTVRDLPRALAEIRRVLRPGGELRFFEHGLARGRVLSRGAAGGGPDGVAAALRRLPHGTGPAGRDRGGGLRGGRVPQAADSGDGPADAVVAVRAGRGPEAVHGGVSPAGGRAETGRAVRTGAPARRPLVRARWSEPAGPGPLVRVAPQWVGSRWFGSHRRAVGPVSGAPYRIRRWGSLPDQTLHCRSSSAMARTSALPCLTSRARSRTCSGEVMTLSPEATR